MRVAAEYDGATYLRTALPTVAPKTALTYGLRDGTSTTPAAAAPTVAVFRPNSASAGGSLDTAPASGVPSPHSSAKASAPLGSTSIIGVNALCRRCDVAGGSNRGAKPAADASRQARGRVRMGGGVVDCGVLCCRRA